MNRNSSIRYSSQRAIEKELLLATGAANISDACTAVVDEIFPNRFTPGRSVDLHKLASIYRIAVEPHSNLSHEGEIERDAWGNATIRVRKGMNRRRERFTLAHELGHFVLQQKLIGTLDGKLFRGVSKSNFEVADEERLANMIASEILLPTAAVRAEVDRNQILASAIRICRCYAVSRHVAIRKIADVFGINLALISLAPYIFSNLESRACVDDAVYIYGGSVTQYARAETKLNTRVKFSDLLGQNASLEFSCPKGFVRTKFDLEYRVNPIPIVTALGEF